jgi:hypothetical protein
MRDACPEQGWTNEPAEQRLASVSRLQSTISPTHAGYAHGAGLTSSNLRKRNYSPEQYEKLRMTTGGILVFKSVITSRTC